MVAVRAAAGRAEARVEAVTAVGEMAAEEKETEERGAVGMVVEVRAAAVGSQVGVGEGWDHSWDPVVEELAEVGLAAAETVLELQERVATRVGQKAVEAQVEGGQVVKGRVAETAEAMVGGWEATLGLGG